MTKQGLCHVQYLEIKHNNSPQKQNKEENHMIIPIDAEKHLFSRFNVHSWLKKKTLRKIRTEGNFINMITIYILFDSTYLKYIEQTNIERHKVNQRLSGVGESWKLFLNSYWVSVWDDGNVLQVASDDSCRTL